MKKTAPYTAPSTTPPTAGDKKKEADLDWEPGTLARHQSLSAFQKELKEQHGIVLSTSKLRKILISGECLDYQAEQESGGAVRSVQEYPEGC